MLAKDPGRLFDRTTASLVRALLDLVRRTAPEHGYEREQSSACLQRIMTGWLSGALPEFELRPRKRRGRPAPEWPEQLMRRAFARIRRTVLTRLREAGLTKSTPNHEVEAILQGVWAASPSLSGSRRGGKRFPSDESTAWIQGSTAVIEKGEAIPSYYADCLVASGLHLTRGQLRGRVYAKKRATSN
jgi:hypothetical protein